MIGYAIKLSKYGEMFYNWHNEDIMVLDEVLMYRVSYQEFKDIICYYGKITSEFYNKIKDNGGYALLSDTKSNVVIRADEDLNVNYIGWLDIKSDLDILEVCYNFKFIKDIFIKGKKKSENEEYRIKDVMIKEVESLFKSKNIEKMRYLIYEWERKDIKNLNKAKDFLLKKVMGNIDDDYYKIYELVKLSNSA